MAKPTWILNTPALYAAIGAAVASILGLLAPDRSVPQPLESYRQFLPVLVGVGVLVALLLHRAVRQHAKRIAYLLIACVLGISIIQAILVRPFGDEFYLVGWQLTGTGEKLCSNCLPEDILARVVPSFGAFSDIWGWSFWVPMLTYIVLYSGLVLGVVAAPAALRGVPER